MFFGSTMVMVTVALVMSVIVTNIYAKKDSRSRAPKWCMRVVLRFYPLPHHPSSSSTPPYIPPSDLSIPELSCPPTFHISHQQPSNESMQEIDEWEQSQRVDNYPNPQFGSRVNNVVRKYLRSDGEFNNERVRHYSGEIQVEQRLESPVKSEDEEEEWMEAEWKVLATFLDRIFFWIFLAMSTIVHGILFKQMVPQ